MKICPIILIINGFSYVDNFIVDLIEYIDNT
jgi:hypothetical protein